MSSRSATGKDVAVFAAARRAKCLNAFFHACETSSVPSVMFLPLLDGDGRNRLRALAFAIQLTIESMEEPSRYNSDLDDDEMPPQEHDNGCESKGGRVTSALLAALPFLTFGPSLRKRMRSDETAAETTTAAEPRRSPTPPPSLHFFVRPPFTNVTSVFVRMRSATTMHEDELNRYFGRYGQIRATPLAAVVGGDVGVGTSTTTVADGGAEASNSSGTTDYIVTVDSSSNAYAAVVEIEHPDVLLVAFVDPQRNACSRDDIPPMCLVGQHGPDSLAHGVIDVGTAGDDGGGLFGSRKWNDDSSAIVPDLVVVGLPVWVTPDQLKEYFLPFGYVEEVRFATDDRSGAFCGAALVRMGTSTGCVKAAAAIHGRVVDGATVSCGVVDPDGNLVHLLTGDTIVAATSSKAARTKGMDELTRLWL